MAEVVTEVDHPIFEPTYTAAEDAGEFVMVILEEDVPTIDGRRFKPGSVEWRDLPIPLMYKTTNDGPGAGHKGSQIGGAITDIWRDGSLIYGAGHFSSNDEGQKLRELIAEGALSGVSADVGGANVELEADAEGKEYRSITQGKIMMVTCLPGQAFDDSRISVTADGGPIDPPTEWFSNPVLTEPTALTVTEDGRIFGHAFTWGACHIGMRDRCLTPPRSKSGYRWFAVGQTMTFGSNPVNTGVLTLDTDHAGITLNAEQSKRHYDHTGVQVADIAMGEDAIGGWFSGALRCNLSQDQIRTIRASAVSGDWRQIGGSLELVGLLVVNTAGFPVPRANVKNNEALALVASGVVTPCGCGECEEAATSNDLRSFDLAVLDSIVFVNHNHTPGRGHANAGGGGERMGYGSLRRVRDRTYEDDPLRTDPLEDDYDDIVSKHGKPVSKRVRYAREDAARRAKALEDRAMNSRMEPRNAAESAAEREANRFREDFVNHNHTPGRGHPNAGGGAKERTIKLADGTIIKHAVDTKSYVNDPIKRAGGGSITNPTRVPGTGLGVTPGMVSNLKKVQSRANRVREIAADSAHVRRIAVNDQIGERSRPGYGSLRRVRDRTHEDDPLRDTNPDPWGVGKNSPGAIAAEQHAEKRAHNIIQSSPGTQSRENVQEATKFFGERGKLTTARFQALEAHHAALTKAIMDETFPEWAAKQRAKRS